MAAQGGIAAALPLALTDGTRAMNPESEIGNVGLGRNADVLVLAANPAQEVGHFSEREAATLAGWVDSRQALQRPERGAD